MLVPEAPGTDRSSFCKIHPSCSSCQPVHLLASLSLLSRHPLFLSSLSTLSSSSSLLIPFNYLPLWSCPCCRTLECSRRSSRKPSSSSLCQGYSTSTWKPSAEEAITKLVRLKVRVTIGMLRSLVDEWCLWQVRGDSADWKWKFCKGVRQERSQARRRSSLPIQKAGRRLVRPSNCLSVPRCDDSE